VGENPHPLFVSERIQTFAGGAVFCRHFAPFGSFGTAITAIEVASTIVVVIVAIAVSLEFCSSATSFAALRVQALTGGAELDTDDTPFDGVDAAITTIVLAPAVVVVVVTGAIPFELRTSACTAAFGGRIEARTLLAVFCRHFAPFDSFGTAITTIVLAPAVVVLVVAVAIPFEIRESTASCAILAAFVGRIQTRTNLAIFHTDRAAITL